MKVAAAILSVSTYNSRVQMLHFNSTSFAADQDFLPQRTRLLELQGFLSSELLFGAVITRFCIGGQFGICFLP